MDMEMPTPCEICGETFDLDDGNPCHKCHKVFCPDCATDTDDGWRCNRCATPKRKKRTPAAGGRG